MASDNEATHLLQSQDQKQTCFANRRRHIQDPSGVSNVLEPHPDFEESLATGDRASVLFALERAVDILKGQIAQEEYQASVRM